MGLCSQRIKRLTSFAPPSCSECRAGQWLNDPFVIGTFRCGFSFLSAMIQSVLCACCINALIRGWRFGAVAKANRS